MGKAEYGTAQKGADTKNQRPFSTHFHAILLSKYNCAVRVEEEYHTEHGQAALRRDFYFDSPVTQ